jgi:hypothetical protein
MRHLALVLAILLTVALVVLALIVSQIMDLVVTKEAANHEKSTAQRKFLMNSPTTTNEGRIKWQADAGA